MQMIQRPVADPRIEGNGLYLVQAKKNARNIPATLLNVSRRAERYGDKDRKKICAGD